MILQNPVKCTANMRVKTPRNIWPLCLFLVTRSYCQATVHQLDRIGLGAVDGGRDAGEQH